MGAPPPRRTPPAAQAASQSAAPQRIEAAVADTATAQQTNVSQSAPNISPRQWQSRVLTHMRRFARFPPAAERSMQRGVPQIWLQIDRAGNILDVQLRGSSGYGILDEAAVAQARQASPLPPPPASIAGDAVTITIPFAFR